MVFIILNHLNIGNMREGTSRMRILGEMASTLESMMPRHNPLFPSVPERYQKLAGLGEDNVGRAKSNQ